MKKKLGKLLSVGNIISTFLVTGCTTMNNGDDDPTKLVQPKPNQVVIVPPSRIEDIGPYASKFAMMAIFSKVVYRKDLPQKARDSFECDYLKSGELPTVGIPIDSGWSRWRGENGEGCLFSQGLALEIYVHGPKDRPDEAVIAYRGTENFNWQASLKDWQANTTAPFGFEPLQYKLAQRHLDQAIPTLLKANPDIRIYATGHSLGGGLAQQAGYYSNSIKEVFAFDPSPVTNWTQLKRNDKLANIDPVIYRVYHWNEALAYVRNITTRFNSRRFRRQDYEFYFQESPKTVSGSVSVHEMGILACHLAANIPGDSADHWLTKKSAFELLNASYRTPPGKPEYVVHPICPEGVVLPKSFFAAKDVEGSGESQAIAAP